MIGMRLDGALPARFYNRCQLLIIFGEMFLGSAKLFVISHSLIKSKNTAYVRITDMNPPAQPIGAQPPALDDTPFKTDVVQNIPMSVQASSEPLKEKDDVEL